MKKIRKELLEMEKKALAIGVDDFKKLIDNECYYVDKSLMIKDILDSKSEVTLFTRPRRFGKTLIQSMLRTYFEKEIASWGENKGKIIDNRFYFKDLKIDKAGEKYTSKMGQYPVISLSLKSAKQPDFDTAYKMLVMQIKYEFKRHKYILEKNMLEDDRKKYKDLLIGKAEYADYCAALNFLSYCLYHYFEKKVIILIDEYDVPLENAYFCGFYDQMISFIRSLFESGLKTNEWLEFSVITGCLRISKESIFTGLNNLEMISVLNDNYGEYFGFTADEVKEMLYYYGISEKYEEAKKWYDGYLFGKAEVYNPWSIINYVKSIRANRQAFPIPYWSNTSSNNIVRELVETADTETKQQIEDLIQGNTILTPIHEEITYEDIHQNKENLWNFLFFTGYLKKVSEKMYEDQKYVELCIPNTEVKNIYRNTIKNWFDQSICHTDFSKLIHAIEDGDCERIQEFIREQLLETISYYDYEESYYHGFLAGILKYQKKYRVKSNREAGEGRYDLVLLEQRFLGDAYIIEIKCTNKIREMEEKCREALQQIESRNYQAELEEDGYTIKGKYGICFFKKGCIVRK